MPTHADERIRHPNAWFFVLAFGFTWGLQIPGVMAQRGLLSLSPETYLPLAMVGIFGPAFAALTLTMHSEGRTGARRLGERFLAVRASFYVYALALLALPILLSAGLWALRPLGYTGPLVLIPEPSRLLTGLVISVAEEIGWRGFALPRLQRSYGAFAASGLLGLLWTLWHIPMFMGLHVPLSLLPVVLLHLIGASLLMTWSHNRSGGSLALATGIHFTAHLNNPHLALPDQPVPTLLLSVLTAAVGLSVARLDREAFPCLHLRARATPHSPQWG